jgi:hypothetical protein
VTPRQSNEAECRRRGGAAWPPGERWSSQREDDQAAAA